VRRNLAVDELGDLPRLRTLRPCRRSEAGTPRTRGGQLRVRVRTL